jgi:hypothetical protein
MPSNGGRNDTSATATLLCETRAGSKLLCSRTNSRSALEEEVSEFQIKISKYVRVKAEAVASVTGEMGLPRDPFERGNAFWLTQ